MSFKQYFESQLKRSPEYTGNYFGEIAPEYFVIAAGLNIVHPTLSVPELVELAKSRKTEFDKHIGQQMVYFIGYTTPRGKACEMFKVWTDEIDALEDQWTFMNIVNDLPRLRKKDAVL